MVWTSIRQVVEEFDLSAAPSDVAAVERELETRRTQLHPDRSQGAFTGPEHADQYHRLDGALRFVQSSGRALMTFEQIMPALALLRELQAWGGSTPPSSEEVIRTQARRLHRHYAVPRVTSATLAAIFTALWGLVGTVEKHPLVQNSDAEIRMIEAEIQALTESTVQGPALSVTAALWEKRVIRDVETELNSVAKGTDPRADNARKLLQNILRQESQGLRSSGWDYSDRSLSSGLDWPTIASDGLLSPALIDRVSQAHRVESLIEKHDLLLYQEESKKRQVQALLIDFALITGAWFVFVWLRESSHVRWVEFLGTERGVRFIFSRVTDPPGLERRAFRRSEFDSDVRDKAISRWLRPFLGRRLPVENVEQVATMVLDKLVARGVVVKRGGASVDPIYDVVDDQRRSAADPASSQPVG